MREFMIAQTSTAAGQPPCWSVEIDGSQHRQYSSQWAAIVGAFVAAHDATLDGEEVTVVMETSTTQVWTFSLLPVSISPVELNEASSLPSVASPNAPRAFEFSEPGRYAKRKIEACQDLGSGSGSITPAHRSVSTSAM
jgi:hypothetical protein